MTPRLPGLRTIPPPSDPRPQAGADLHEQATHSECLCSPCEVVIAAASAGGAGSVAGLAHPPYDLRAEILGQLAAAGLGGR